MGRLGCLTGVILFFVIFESVKADFLEAETEVVGFENHYYDGSGANLCPFQCGDFCEDRGGEKIRCAGHAGELFQRCTCEKTIPITEYTCLSAKSRCYNTSFVPVYRDSKCYCTCKNNHCDNFCDKTHQLGKCKPENKQQLSKNPCQCYCTKNDCERKKTSFFRKASCNSRGECVTVCNGTQEGLPSWCRFRADKCNCYCNDSHCQQYCINEKNNPYGICAYGRCVCQVTPFRDYECGAYCKKRTGDKEPAQLPTKAGYCECRYTNILRLCYANCERSSTCSVNDATFCKDDPRASNISSTKQTPCSGKLCWGEPIIYNAPQNASLEWVFASTRMESDIDFKWVVCRSSILWFGIVRMKKLGPKTSLGKSKDNDCLLIQYVPIGKKYFGSTNRYHGLIGQRCGFKMMKKGDKIPKEAFEIVGPETNVFKNNFYFGRDKANNTFGGINNKGIMIGGNPDTDDWKTQKPVYPEIFEILVCT